MKNTFLAIFLAIFSLAINPAGLAQSGELNDSTQTNCPANNFLEPTPNTENSAYPAPKLKVTCSENSLVIESNGIPNFEFVEVTPNYLLEQNYKWQLPLNPTFASNTTAVPLAGTSAIAVNGLPIFGPTEAPHHGSRDPYLDDILDYCNGHTAPRGDYHFHARPDCLFTNAEGNTSLVVAYALDGFPILAPYMCTDADCTEIKKVSSSYRQVEEAYSTTIQNAWDAHEYVEGLSDLDECNGATLADGSYVYFATNTFPYFMGCYKGEVGISALLAGGPPKGSSPQESIPRDGSPPQEFGHRGGPPNFDEAASKLGITVEKLRSALGPPPHDFEAAAQTLGITVEKLMGVLPPPPPSPPSQEFGHRGGPPNFDEAASKLGITVEELRNALGPPPHDFEAAAQTLGITVEKLMEVLPPPPPGPPSQEFGHRGGPPNFDEAASKLGITVEELRNALGPPPHDFEAAAQILGITVEELMEVLPLPPRRPGGGPPPGPPFRGFNQSSSINFDDFVEASSKLGITVKALKTAIGPSTTNFNFQSAVHAAQVLGITLTELIEVLPLATSF